MATGLPSIFILTGQKVPLNNALKTAAWFARQTISQSPQLSGAYTSRFISQTRKELKSHPACCGIYRAHDVQNLHPLNFVRIVFHNHGMGLHVAVKLRAIHAYASHNSFFQFGSGLSIQLRMYVYQHICGVHDGLLPLQKERGKQTIPYLGFTIIDL
jgi:hypothetical protein